MSGQAAVTVYSSGNYKFGVKMDAEDKDLSETARIRRLQEKYPSEGTRHSVEGVLLVSERNTPHVLLIQVLDSEGDRRGVSRPGGGGTYLLPGGRLRPGEDETECLKRKLASRLAPLEQSLKPNWRVGECIAQFWRPGFDASLFPYLPPHITRPKEVKKVFVVPLPEKAFFEVAQKQALVAVPLFELYGNPGKFGAVAASLPAALSRLRLTLMSGGGKPIVPMRAIGAASSVPAGEGTADVATEEWVDEEAAQELYGD